MLILVKVKSVYGREAIYPANQYADVLANIAKTKTLSRDNLADAKRLGHTVEVASDCYNLA